MERKPNKKIYNDIAVGDRAAFSVVVTKELIAAFADVSGDSNPLHMDDGYAGGTPFGKRIAHGMLVGSFFSQLVGMHLPGLYSVYLSQTLRFRVPVPIGTVLTVRGEVTHKTDSSKTVTIHMVAEDADSPTIFVDGEAMVQLLK
jgi:3-hydroxybutyryl-CoA dehydratase